MNTNLISIDAGVRRRRAVLEARLSELLKASGERDSLEIQPMADPLDQVRQSTERDMAVETLNQQARSIREIQAALVRIAENSYGRCESCEDQIPTKRLHALPWARLCVTCQSKSEAEGQQARTAFDSAA